jgi:aspartyl-tRNA(Asn)/glutamyl-tRNA(Gln) amidotransferase subunit C
MVLDHKTVQSVAKLARIHMDETEIAKMVEELNGILVWIEQLNEVDVSGLDSPSEPDSTALMLREDVVDDGGEPEWILFNAPDRSGDFFAVPKVIT